MSQTSNELTAGLTEAREHLSTHDAIIAGLEAEIAALRTELNNLRDEIADSIAGS